MSESEKLSKDKFVEETITLNKYVLLEMSKIFDKYTEIDESFEKDISELHNDSVKKMIKYGELLVKKDAETRSDYIEASLMAMWENMDNAEVEAFEKKFEDRLPELQTNGSDRLGEIFNDLFGLMDFMNFEDAKDRHPETAKEFGIQ